MAEGEQVRLRDHRTGEVVFLRALPVSGKGARASIEISRAQNEADLQRTDLVELSMGESATVRHPGSRLDLQLLAAPVEPVGSAAKEDDDDLFQVNLDLPGGYSLTAVGYASADELIRVDDHRTGLSLGFRPAMPKSVRPMDIEVFSLGASDNDVKGARFLARVPIGGDFNLRGDRLGLVSEGAAPLKIHGRVQRFDSERWGEMAKAGSRDGGPVALQARWAGGPWIRGKAFGGFMFRLSVPGAEDEIGLAPASTCSSGSRSVSVFRIGKVPGSGETLKLVDTVQVRDDQPVRVLGFGGQLELQGVAPVSLQLKGACWLGCGDTTACGCSVSCGGVDCCVGMCCRY